MSERLTPEEQAYYPKSGTDVRLDIPPPGIIDEPYAGRIKEPEWYLPEWPIRTKKGAKNPKKLKPEKNPKKTDTEEIKAKKQNASNDEPEIPAYKYKWTKYEKKYLRFAQVGAFIAMTGTAAFLINYKFKTGIAIFESFKKKEARYDEQIFKERAELKKKRLEKQQAKSNS